MTEKKFTPEEIETEVQFLLDDYGVSREFAEEFVKSKISGVVLKVPGNLLVEVLSELLKKSVVLQPITIPFFMPQARLEEFKRFAEEVINQHGGFLLTEAEQAGIAQVDPNKLN